MAVFNENLGKKFNTQLVAHGGEPLYLPADLRNTRHKIIFRKNFVSSALHELAHWCIAGAQRRRKRDYGYWYRDEDRTYEQQLAFLQIESKPQAIESIFSDLCQQPFHPSLDNFSHFESDLMDRFADQIQSKKSYYRQHGLPTRAKELAEQFKTRFAAGL